MFGRLRPHQERPELREVVIADESGREQIWELREGEVLLLGEEYRYVYGGRAESSGAVKMTSWK